MDEQMKLREIHPPEYEDIGYEPSRRIVCREFDLPEFTSPYHRHPETEIAVILSSSGTLHVGGEVTVFQPGDCFVLGKNLPHQFHNEHSADLIPERAHSIVVQFDETCFHQLVESLPEVASIRTIMDRSGRGIRVGEKASRKVRDIVGMMLYCGALERITLLFQIFTILEQEQKTENLLLETTSRLSDRNADRIATVTRYLYDNVDQHIRLEHLAELSGMNRSAFSRFFKYATGKNVFRYLQEIRFHKACGLLRFHDSSITEIAFACGFENLSSFNRVFKKFSGVTPRDYRKGSKSES